MFRYRYSEQLFKKMRKNTLADPGGVVPKESIRFDSKDESTNVNLEMTFHKMLLMLQECTSWLSVRSIEFRELDLAVFVCFVMEINRFCQVLDCAFYKHRLILEGRYFGFSMKEY